MKKPLTFKRGDVVRVVVTGKRILASVVAIIEANGKTRFVCLTETGKTVQREAMGMTPGEPKDRERLTSAIAALAEDSRK